MDAPVVSLVMCAWNPREDWLALAVESALRSTANGELVLVDDGSNKPIDALVPPRPRLRIVRTEHAGLPHARNVGMDAARGRYVRFMDADDVFGAGRRTSSFAPQTERVTLFHMDRPLFVIASLRRPRYLHRPRPAPPLSIAYWDASKRGSRRWYFHALSRTG